jgi:hypothetical protein
MGATASENTLIRDCRKIIAIEIIGPGEIYD